MKANVAAATLLPAVTVSVPLVLVLLVARSEGLQSSILPEPGTNATASIV